MKAKNLLQTINNGHIFCPYQGPIVQLAQKCSEMLAKSSEKSKAHQFLNDVRQTLNNLSPKLKKKAEWLRLKKNSINSLKLVVKFAMYPLLHFKQFLNQF